MIVLVIFDVTAIKFYCETEMSCDATTPFIKITSKNLHSHDAKLTIIGFNEQLYLT